MNTRPSGQAPKAFGRFEADAANVRWTGDGRHGPTVGGRKAILCAFIDDHSRLAVRRVRRAGARCAAGGPAHPAGRGHRLALGSGNTEQGHRPGLLSPDLILILMATDHLLLLAIGTNTCPRERCRSKGNAQRPTRVGRRRRACRPQQPPTGESRNYLPRRHRAHPATGRRARHTDCLDRVSQDRTRRADRTGQGIQLGQQRAEPAAHRLGTTGEGP